MFSCRPALKVAMLISPCLREDEIVFMRGARPYSEYTGYLDTFRFVGDSEHLKTWVRTYGKDSKSSAPVKTELTPVPDNQGLKDKKSAPPPSRQFPPEVIAIDAIVATGAKYEFMQKTINRDVDKAWLGFGGGFDDLKTKRSGPISTGMWGCGAFGGNPTLKFLQQIMAAAEVGRTLYFSTFKNRTLESQFTQLHEKLRANKVTVGQLYKAIVSYKSTLGTASFFHRPDVAKHVSKHLGLN
mmetsp:Transcript_952/g.1817  ORF Transcript_952/g.1817 Transcript_952/m.1817 type:complete len:241 (+) Transcript_952:75-797(+)